MRLPLALALALAAGPARACALALALVVDVSGSIDPGEYRFQADGLAEALVQPDVADALVQRQAALMVMQFSGAGDQAVMLSWQRMLSPQAVATFAENVAAMPRRWSGGKTAVGEAVTAAQAQFAAVADCPRRVIDISGDGMTNDGTGTIAPRAAARRAGVTINALAIDRMGASVTQFFRTQVITGRDAFVETARGYSDYPAAMRRKLYREIVVPAS
ncbi:DUF1194 domain-containing protein [Halovulum dunhuangense]|uniref:DUF1194 domain-containing protein n=1 Tax=Halovulum dunhuangense TaxID=1505036 RepID=A0A849L6A3_9RHOB|nr:DUF1194 domain-containing protein [Halovulum dunhuangense]NNU81949.1 DUF1194 domain-containing protein [Halovulum dunhuangense]